MHDHENEDRFIAHLVIAVSSAAMLGVLALATVITAMVSANFNILQWME